MLAAGNRQGAPEQNVRWNSTAPGGHPNPGGRPHQGKRQARKFQQRPPKQR
jgi:hypothetical protein